jgi:hypothetical protein
MTVTLSFIVVENFKFYYYNSNINTKEQQGYENYFDFFFWLRWGGRGGNRYRLCGMGLAWPP